MVDTNPNLDEKLKLLIDKIRAGNIPTDLTGYSREEIELLFQEITKLEDDEIRGDRDRILEELRNRLDSISQDDQEPDDFESALRELKQDENDGEVLGDLPDEEGKNPKNKVINGGRSDTFWTAFRKRRRRKAGGGLLDNVRLAGILAASLFQDNKYVQAAALTAAVLGEDNAKGILRLGTRYVPRILRHTPAATGVLAYGVGKGVHYLGTDVTPKTINGVARIYYNTQTRYVKGYRVINVDDYREIGGKYSYLDDPGFLTEYSIKNGLSTEEYKQLKKISGIVSEGGDKLKKLENSRSKYYRSARKLQEKLAKAYDDYGRARGADKFTDNFSKAAYQTKEYLGGAKRRLKWSTQRNVIRPTSRSISRFVDDNLPLAREVYEDVAARAGEMSAASRYYGNKIIQWADIDPGRRFDFSGLKRGTTATARNLGRGLRSGVPTAGGAFLVGTLIGGPAGGAVAASLIGGTNFVASYAASHFLERSRGAERYFEQFQGMKDDLRVLKEAYNDLQEGNIDRSEYRRIEDAIASSQSVTRRHLRRLITGRLGARFDEYLKLTDQLEQLKTIKAQREIIRKAGQGVKTAPDDEALANQMKKIEIKIQGIRSKLRFDLSLWGTIDSNDEYKKWYKLYRNDYSEMRRKIQDLTDEYRRGEFTKRELNKRIRELRSEFKALEKRLLKDSPSRISKTINKIDDFFGNVSENLRPASILARRRLNTISRPARRAAGDFVDNTRRARNSLYYALPGIVKQGVGLAGSGSRRIGKALNRYLDDAKLLIETTDIPSSIASLRYRYLSTIKQISSFSKNSEMLERFRKLTGKVPFNRRLSMTAQVGLIGSLPGAAVGLAFGNPVLGALAGAAVTGSWRYVSLSNQEFIRKAGKLTGAVAKSSVGIGIGALGGAGAAALIGAPAAAGAVAGSVLLGSVALTQNLAPRTRWANGLSGAGLGGGLAYTLAAALGATGGNLLLASAIGLGAGAAINLGRLEFGPRAGLGKNLGRFVFAGSTFAGLADGGNWLQRMRREWEVARSEGRSRSEFLRENFDPTDMAFINLQTGETGGLLNITYGSALIEDIYTSSSLGGRAAELGLRAYGRRAPGSLKAISKRLGVESIESTVGLGRGLAMIGRSSLTGGIGGTILGSVVGGLAGGVEGAFTGAAVGGFVGGTIGTASGAIRAYTSGAFSSVGVRSIGLLGRVNLFGTVGAVIGSAATLGFAISTGAGGVAIASGIAAASTGAAVGALIGTGIAAVVGGFTGGIGFLASGAIITGTSAIVSGIMGRNAVRAASYAVDRISNTFGQIFSAARGGQAILGAINGLMTLMNFNANMTITPQKILSLYYALNALLPLFYWAANEQSQQTLIETFNPGQAIYSDQNVLAASDGAGTIVTNTGTRYILGDDSYVAEPNEASVYAQDLYEKGYYEEEFFKLYLDDPSFSYNLDLLYEDLTPEINFIDDRFNLNNINPGDLVFFQSNSGEITSIGVVYEITKDYVRTIEPSELSTPSSTYYTISFMSDRLSFYNGKYILGFVNVR